MKIVNNKVKIGARIPHQLYFMFKYICMKQGVTMESKIEELLAKDVMQTSKKKWFVDHLKQLEMDEPSVSLFFNMVFKNDAEGEDGKEV